MQETKHSFQGDGIPPGEVHAQIFDAPALTKRRRAVWLRYYRDGMEKPVYADLKARALRAGASASRQLGEGGEQA